jgi:alcohol dehydrogenase class IV
VVLYIIFINLGNQNATIEEGITWLNSLLIDLKIPKLSVLCQGIEQKDFEIIIKNTLEASSTKGNPVKLDFNDLNDILLKAF